MRIKADLSDPRKIYNEEYFQKHLGIPYDRNSSYWIDFFGKIADWIIKNIKPHTVMDIGCAKGFLVEALRDRGVEAYGVDISNYAISQVREDIQQFCIVGSATEPLDLDYDLIVCIEILEHLAPKSVEAAIRNMAARTECILFSSNPNDFDEPTHINVRPVSDWLDLFSKAGFYPDLVVDTSCVSPQAFLLRKRAPELHKEVLPFFAQSINRKFEVIAQQKSWNEQIKQLQAEIQTHKQALLQKDERISQLKGVEEAQNQELQRIHSSLSWKFINIFWKFKDTVMPKNTRRRRLYDLMIGWLKQEHIFLRFSAIWRGCENLLLKSRITIQREGWKSFVGKVYKKTLGGKSLKAIYLAMRRNIEDIDLYEKWISENEPTESELRQQVLISKDFPYRPLISIITPVFKPPLKVLMEAIDSVLKQTYDHWELCIVDGNSEDKTVRKILEQYARRDLRVRVKFLHDNRGISGNSNEALQLARGEFIALLDQDDLLAPFALFEVVKCLNKNKGLDFIYSDRDHLSEDGKLRCQPLFKPAWSPEIMLSANYLTHLTVMRKKHVDEIGGFLSEMDGAQDWDLFLRMTERTNSIAHIPKILYHWRKSATSAAWSIKAKPYAPAAQLQAVQAHLERRGISGKVEFDPSGPMRVRLHVSGKSRVSIIIPTKDNVPLLKKCIESILTHTQYQNFEIILVDNGSSEPETNQYYQSISSNPRISIIEYKGPFNYSAVNNAGALRASGNIFLFLNNDTEVIQADWLEEMGGWIEQKDIGVVGSKLLRPDGTIQHAGVVIGLQGFAGHVFAGIPDDYVDVGAFGSPAWYRDYIAVTGACLMIRREVFEKIGGFNEEFVLCGSDVELCLRVRDRGYRIMYTPFAQLKHKEAATRGQSIPSGDFKVSYKHYETILSSGDPYFNPNLSHWDTIPRPKIRCEQSPLEYVHKLLREGAKDSPVTLHKNYTPTISNLWQRYSADALSLAEWLDFTHKDLVASQEAMGRYRGFLDIKSITWFIPDFHHPYYGGINTILRFANYFKEYKGVRNRFIVLGDVLPKKISTLIGEAFPSLREEEVFPLLSEKQLHNLKSSDAAISTLWSTAYPLLKFNKVKRKFYFLQDFEPSFYPAGTTNAQAEATYRFNFYGIANTVTIHDIYTRRYGGKAGYFSPCVDIKIFYPTSEQRPPGNPFKIFFYGRPGHPRNGFELGIVSLRKIKNRFGKKVTIVTAGDNWQPEEFGLEGIVDNLGLLDILDTATLYRTCDVGLSMMFTQHPSYIPLELMASGCLVVTNENSASKWLLKHNENSLLSAPSASCLAETIELGLTNIPLRTKIIKNAVNQVRTHYHDWRSEMEKVYRFMCQPE